ncbi:MAG TPA: HAD family phosphatase [Candidatus Saccharimonadales bacterium]|jgi:HAD superfamily hydrolase (TIGR01509 family)|nr:HAD family phosphatase [Candidatus Saccharimonadales bacterium]
MFKAAIFDMDGVMVDTEHIQSRAFEIILSELGITAKKTKHGTVHVAGGTTHKIWDTLKKQYHFDADTEELIKKKRVMVLNVIRQGIEPLPGLLDLLADLQGREISLAIATSAQKERAELITEKIGVGKHFTVTITANDVINVKPAPDVYLKAAELLGVRPADCIV